MNGAPSFPIAPGFSFNTRLSCIAQIFLYIEDASDALVDELDEHLGGDEAFAELGVELGGGFGGYGFVGGFALLLEGGDFLADGGEHVEGVGELGLVADGAVAGDDDGGVGPGGEIALSGADHAVDVAAGGVVDEGVGAVEPGVAGVEDVGFGEVDRDVGVGVGGVVMLEVEGFAVGGEHIIVGEDEGGKGVGWEGWEGGVEDGDDLRVAEAEAGLLVGDDLSSDRVDPLVAVGVVVVPVGVDEVLDGVGADGGEGFGDLRA